MEIPFPPPLQKSSSLILSSLLNPRVTLDKVAEYEQQHVRKLDLNMDEKKLRRIISNRLSAKRYRKRGFKYIHDMEKKVKDLQETISFLTQQVHSCKEKQKELLLENNSLQKLVENRSHESKISEIELEKKRLELCRLKELAKATNNNNSYDFDSGSQLLQVSKFNQLTSKPYTLEFYQNGLKKLVSNQFWF